MCGPPLSLRSGLPLLDVVGIDRFLQRLFDEDKERHFHRPVKESEAPDYYQRTAHPMDLSTVKSRYKGGALSGVWGAVEGGGVDLEQLH